MPSADAHAQAIETRVPLATLIADLSRPGALVPGETARVVQTHISAVFVAGDRAWKVKKPMRLWGLVDYGSVAARRHWCEEEVRLNRRLAPGLYLGVVPIRRGADGLTTHGTGEIVEHAVLMRQFPVGATLLEQLAAGTLDAASLQDTARLLADFHAHHRLAPPAADGALPSRLGRTLQANFQGSTGGMPDPFPVRVHEGLRTRIFRRLWRARARLRRRVREGRITDGHGDIRLEHVLRLDGATAIVDCCEFSTSLRHIDPLSDAAFLSMDLTVRGRPDLAAAYEHAYLEAADDADGPWLLPLYRAYRAHVRAMVDEQSCRETAVPTEVRARKALGARRTLGLAWSEARTGAVPPLIVLRGPAGVGKTWLGERLAPWLRAEILRGDVIRKELLGVDPTWRPDTSERADVYGMTMHLRTYQTMLERAREALARGHAALLDATYLKRAARDHARALARELGAPYAVIDITCDPEVVRRRLVERARRGTDASDADQAIHDEMVRTAEPLEGEEAGLFVRHDSSAPPEHVILPLLDVLEAQLDAGTESLEAVAP